MIAQYKQRAIGAITGGIILAGLGARSIETLLAPFIFIGGFACYILGCMFFAQAKGYNRVLGAILGALVIGVVVIFFLKDKSENEEMLEEEDAN